MSDHTRSFARPLNRRPAVTEAEAHSIQEGRLARFAQRSELATAETTTTDRTPRLDQIDRIRQTRQKSNGDG